jgi:hypothetical protein
MSYGETFKFKIAQYICKFISPLLSSLFFYLCEFVWSSTKKKKCLCACVFDTVSAPNFYRSAVDV